MIDLPIRLAALEIFFNFFLPITAVKQTAVAEHVGRHKAKHCTAERVKRLVRADVIAVVIRRALDDVLASAI